MRNRDVKTSMKVRKNIVSIPPLSAKIADPNGRVSIAWATWFRDLFDRTSSKEVKGNAIDNIVTDNSIVIDQITATNASLAKTIEKVNHNHDEIHNHVSDIEKHKIYTEASTDYLGLVRRMKSVRNAIINIASITTPSLLNAPNEYQKENIQTMVNAINEQRTAINELIRVLNDTNGIINDILAKSKSAGQMND